MLLFDTTYLELVEGRAKFVEEIRGWVVGLDLQDTLSSPCLRVVLLPKPCWLTTVRTYHMADYMPDYSSPTEAWLWKAILFLALSPLSDWWHIRSDRRDGRKLAGKQDGIRIWNFMEAIRTYCRDSLVEIFYICQKITKKNTIFNNNYQYSR